MPDYPISGRSGLGTDYSFFDNGKTRQGIPLRTTMAFDAAPKPERLTAPATTAYRPITPVVKTAIIPPSRKKPDMATDTDVRGALSKLVEFLQSRMNAPELDDISIMLDGGSDPDTGGQTAAMDRVLRRRTAATGRQTPEQSAAYAQRFPNASRLVR